MSEEMGPSSPDGSGDSELMMELRSFLEGSVTNSRHRCRHSAYLLENLPCSRDAVLEYYSDLILERDSERLPSVREVLLSFLDRDRQSWAPVLGRWSLELLGEFSGKYPPPAQNDMDEVMRFMMDFEGVRLLTDIASQCFSILGNSSKEEDKESDLSSYPVSTLLKTSVRHSPHFDWVVAYIGASFPESVISGVLSAGLNHFYERVSSSTTNDCSLQGPSESEDSVVGILDHLISSQGESAVRFALRALIEKSLDNVKFNKANSLEICTLPYFLHLASISPSISKALTAESTRLLRSKDVLEKIVKLVPKWNKTYFHSSGSLSDLVVHLIVGSRDNGADILKLMLEISEFGLAQSGCKILVEVLLCELFTLAHSQQQTPVQAHKNRNPRHEDDNEESDKEIPCLSSVSEKLYLFLNKDTFLSPDTFLQQVTSSLLQLTSLLHSPSGSCGRGVAIKTIKYCLSSDLNDNEIGLLLKFIRDTELWHKDIVHFSVSQCIRESKRHPENSLILLDNLVRILEYERQPEREVRIVSTFESAIRRHHEDLLGKLTKIEYISRVLKLLRLVPLAKSNLKKGKSDDISISLLHRSVQNIVYALFLVFSEGLNCPQRTELILDCEQILSELSSSYPISLPIILRFLMEGVLCSEYAAIFGGKYQHEEKERILRKDKFNKKNLMDENMKYGSTPPIGATTTYHAGVIGCGPKLVSNEKENETAAQNRLLFVNVLFKICQFESKDKSKEASKQLALLCVDLVSPDIMYNGLPWPEEEYTRVTVERDLKIKKTFLRHPILWSILFGLAESRPALCYCSVLIRALMAVVMAHWQSAASIVKKTSEHPKQLEETQRILELMAVGQFLPHPLRSVGDIIPVLSPFHVHCILVDIWNYMRDNVPSPTSFMTTNSGTIYRQFEAYKNFKSHCERLRLIMLKYLPQVAVEFKNFFVLQCP